MKSLGLLISDRPASGPYRAGLLAASEALIRGEWVGIYLLDEAVQGVGSEELIRLTDDGLHLFACSHAARVFGVAITSSAIFGGLSMLGDLLAKVSCFAHPSRLGKAMHFFQSVPPGQLRRILMQVTGDPRKSGKPAEAVRAGIGLSAWSQVEVDFCFVGASALAFAEDLSGLLGEDLLERYVPSLLEWPRPIYLLAPLMKPLEMRGAGGKFVCLSKEESDRVEAEHDVLLRL